MTATITTLIVSILIGIGIFLVLRWFWLWYWKIDKIVELLEKLDNNVRRMYLRDEPIQ